MARPGIIAGITILLGATLLAQEWSTYTNRLDRFEVNFPGQPLMIVLALAAPVFAHHSHGNYNMTEYTTLKGVVKEVHWINPHTWIYIEVKDEKGEPTVWALEGASVIQVERRGGRKT
jgi:hypothetical protein